MQKMVSKVLINDIIGLVNSEIKHIGLGTGSCPHNEDILLDIEQIRKPATHFIDENVLIKEIYLDTSEGNNKIYTNLGAFKNSTDIIDTGQLELGGEINVEKLSNETLTVSIEIQIEGE